MVSALILAAGAGTRMKSDKPKVAHEVLGKPLVRWVIDAAHDAGIKDIISVLGYQSEKVAPLVEDDTQIVIQESQLGTGDAVNAARDAMTENGVIKPGSLIVLSGDCPLITPETIVELVKKQQETQAAVVVLTMQLENPFGYGRIVKENGNVIGIVEEKEASDEIKKIKEVNAGVYCCNAKELFKALDKIDNNNEKGEYYLTDIIGIQVKEGKKVSSFVLEDSEEILGVNSKVELAQASRVLRERKNKELMEEGVILIDPATTYIEETVKIGKDTVIYPGVILQGNTVIGENCEIIGNTRIIDSVLKNDIRVESSVIEESILEDKVTMGPFAHLRPKAHLKEKVHIGNFVEVKKSTLEPGVKAGHLTYLGNATVGRDTNIGAGTITCNYDGINKFDTNIGEKVFIGSSTMLVAPVNIGDNALTGAGSVITKDVPEDALAVERNKQIIKLKWRK